MCCNPRRMFLPHNKVQGKLIAFFMSVFEKVIQAKRTLSLKRGVVKRRMVRKLRDGTLIVKIFPLLSHFFVSCFCVFLSFCPSFNLIVCSSLPFNFALKREMRKSFLCEFKTGVRTAIILDFLMFKVSSKIEEKISI